MINQFKLQFQLVVIVFFFYFFSIPIFINQFCQLTENIYKWCINTTKGGEHNSDITFHNNVIPTNPIPLLKESLVSDCGLDSRIKSANSLKKIEPCPTKFAAEYIIALRMCSPVTHCVANVSPASCWIVNSHFCAPAFSSRVPCGFMYQILRTIFGSRRNFFNLPTGIEI